MAPFELDLVNLDVICSKGKPNGTVEQRVVNWIEVHHVGGSAAFGHEKRRTRDRDKIPLLDDEYMRTEACIRVAILRGSCGDDSGSQVHLFLCFPGAPVAINTNASAQNVCRAESMTSRNGKHPVTCENNDMQRNDD